MSDRGEEVRDYAFADQALALRKRAGLTQRELADLLPVSAKSIEAWEAGLSYPSTEHLKQVIALYLERGLLLLGREAEEAAALWATVRTKAARRTVPFDPTWFAALHGTHASTRSIPALPQATPAVPVQRHDWGDAPALPVIQGRADELATLAHWVTEEHCRLVQVLGAGGIGKTTVAVRLAYELAPRFAVVYWRSLRNALPVEEWLAGAIAALSGGQAVLPEGIAARLVLLLELLRAQRALLVLDNLETILEPGSPEVRYRAGYEAYEVVLQQVARSQHLSCLLLTSREQPLPVDESAVRALRLQGLGADAAGRLLISRGLVGDEAAWQALVDRYAGNPLALRIVGESIGAVFAGDTAAFLAQAVAVFGGIRQLLDEQVGRLSALEQAILMWLAVGREPVGFAAVVADLGPGVRRDDAVEAVEALLRRSLLEWGAGGTFTLQPLVLEYATARLVETCAREILVAEPALLISRALLKATAKDYVRRTQERLIAQPLLERLGASLGGAPLVERQLLALLGRWREQRAASQGYGPGNVVNLLRLLRGDLRGLDFSRLAIRCAYLPEVDAQDASLAGAHLGEVVLAEAFAYPTSVALSADSTLLVVGTLTGEVWLWRVADRTPLLAVQKHSGGVWAVALSVDGRLVASAALDGTVRFWEAESGRPLAGLQGHSGGVRCVALSADGRLAASGGFDGTVRLWEAVEEGRPLATLQGHSGGIRSVALSADGRLVASGSLDGTVHLWGVADRRPLMAVQGHSGGVLAVAMSADGTLLASGGSDGAVRLWAVEDGRPLATLQGHSGGVWAVALSADGTLLAAGTLTGEVRLWRVADRTPLLAVQGHSSGVWAVAVSGDGRLVATGSEDGTVRLWEAGSGWPLASLQGHSGGVRSMALSADARLVASGGFDGTVRLWEAESGRPLASLQERSGGVWAVALSGDGRLVASGGLDGTVRLWEAESGQPLASLQGHSGGVRSMVLSADGRLVASGSEDGTARLWAVEDGRPLATLQGHSGGVWAVALSGDSWLVASGGLDGTVRLWAAESGQPLATLQGHSGGVRSVALSTDGRLVASGSEDGTVRLWAVEDGRLLATLRGHSGGVWAVALSGDSLLVASGGLDGTVRLWAAGSGRPLAILRGHSGDVRSVVLSADGRLVASGGLDGTVRLWEAGSGACLRTLRSDRRYERLDITGLTGVTEAQREVLRALGAVEQIPAHNTQPAPTKRVT